MRKLRIFFVELILVGLLVAWFFERFPQSVDKFIPWIMLAILWHLTWEICNVGYLKSKAEHAYEKWGPRHMTWLFVFCAGGVVSLGYWGSIRWSLAKLATTKHGEQKSQPEDDIEANILAWMRDGEYMAIPLSDPSTYFNFLVKMTDGKIIQVCKPREFLGERYLLVIARVKPTPQQVEALKSFSPYEQKCLVSDLKLELGKFKNAWSVPGPPYEGLVIEKHLPITEPLTEDAFIGALNEVGSEMNISTQITIKAVDSHAANEKQQTRKEGMPKQEHGNLKVRAIALSNEIATKMAEVQSRLPNPNPTTKAEVDQNFGVQSVHFRWSFLPRLIAMRDEFAQLHIVNEDLNRFLSTEAKRKKEDDLPRHILNSDITDVVQELRQMAGQL
jgi:hypothetical protein